MQMRRTLLTQAAAMCSGLATGLAQSQPAYPTKPIRLIVPAATGGGTDTMARLIANALSESRKWQIVVENMPGAGGNIVMEQVARASKDGYTIGIGESSNMVINPYLYSKMPFNVETDLEPLILLAKVPLVLLVSVNSRLDSVSSLIAAAKQQPLSFASAGNGTVGHLVGELWKRRVGIAMTHIPYKSAALAMTDVAGGHVDLFFASITSALPLIKAGKVRPLAVTSTARSQLKRDVPSLWELGYKDVDASVVFGLMAPKGTPTAITGLLNAEVNRVLASASARQTLGNLGADEMVYGGDAKHFSAFLWHERQQWSKVVKDSGARVD